jgi:hypothetical protein
MTTQNKPGPDMDQLLRVALPDDLPVDIEAGMRRRIDRFRAEKAERPARTAAGAWLFRRSVWAALSILMLVAGLLLQGAKASSPLAERITLVKAAYASVDTTGR